MKRVVLTVLFLSVLILNGCIVSTTPSSFFITMNQGDTLEFSTVVFPATDEVQWTLLYNWTELDIATGNTYTFKPLMKGIYEMTMEDIMGTDGYVYSKTWLITVQ